MISTSSFSSMSENPLLMQGLTPHRRTSKARYATSCTECRRRKQKCNQGRPCSNCVRRFPQPTCEYTTRTIKRPTGQGSFSNPNLKLVLEGNAYAHLDLTEVQDAILQIEGLGASAPGIHSADLIDLQTSSSLPPRSSLCSAAAPSASTATFLPSPSASNSSSTFSSSVSSVPASDLSLASAAEPFHVVVTDESGTLKPKSLIALLQVILRARLKVANRIVNDEWSIDGSQLLQAVLCSTRPPTMVGGLDDQLRNLPMEPTRMNTELVRIHLQLLSRFKASIDGNPDPESRFMKHWVPLSLKDPLLLHIVLYTATCFLNETGRVPKALVWAYKGAVHKMLNEQLRSTKTQTNDAAIMGTAQMVVDSWYWGTTEEVRAHMAGLKTMVKMRGGPQFLGWQGFLAKTVLIHDIVIALAHDIEPTMYGVPGFEFRDEFMVPYQVSFNSPLLSDWPPFHTPACMLRTHPLSAAILDDMRSVITAALSLPLRPTPEQLLSLEQTVRWYLVKLNEMPPDVTVHDDGDGDADSPRHSARAASEDSGGSSTPAQSVGAPLDMMYRCIRATAPIYYRAILERTPTTEVLSGADYLKLWGMVWQVPLSTWRTAMGIFVWIMIASVPSSHQTPAARFVKTFMVTAFMMVGLENWHVAMDTAQAGLRLQAWLRSAALARDDDDIDLDDDDDGGGGAGGDMRGGVQGGERMVDKHGFYLFRDEVPEVAELRVDEDESDFMM